MSTQRRLRARSQTSVLSSADSNENKIIPAAKSVDKISVGKSSPNDTNKANDDTTIAKAPFRPGKWRKSMSLLRSSICRREGSVAGERRITMYMSQMPNSTNETASSEGLRFSEAHEVSVHQFVQSLTWKTVADHHFLCPKSPKDEILARCGQQEPISFEKALANLDVVVERKIGEGVYGEVYLCAKPSGVQSVLKLVPIEGSCLINGEKQKTYEEILSEVIISAELSSLRQHNVQFSTDGFVELRSVSCLVGKYPERLVELWEEYDEKHGSENDCPSEFPNEQHYIAFETAFGGCDLDGFRFNNAQQAFAIYAQIVLMLAVAEKRYDFEHRDLHTGNILIEHTKEAERTYYLLGEEIVIQTHGLKATIIDYTLSRIVYNGLCLFNDLSTDEELFTAEGDYQFEIYRNMKAALQNQWNLHSPKTNVYWLHYLLDKLTSLRSFRGKPSKAHKTAMKTMKQLKDVLLRFSSVHDIVCHYFVPQLDASNQEN